MASTGLTAEGAQLCQRPQGETWGVQSGPLIFALASNRGIRVLFIQHAVLWQELDSNSWGESENLYHCLPREVPRRLFVPKFPIRKPMSPFGWFTTVPLQRGSLLHGHGGWKRKIVDP